MPGKKTKLDISSLSRRCEADGCAKWPLYGNEGEKAKFCSFHKSASMIDVRSRRCGAPGCKRQPSYAFEGKRAAFCAAHKEEGMVDVVSRRCEEPNCRRRPLYGYEGQRSQFCSAHKKEGQVDVCNRRCARQGCSKRPCFGLPGQRPTFCGSHRSPEMVDVISRKCGYPGCSQPTGHEAGRVRSKFCDKHKSAGLVGASLLQLAGTAAEDSAPAAAVAAAAAAATSAGKGKGAHFPRPPPTPPSDERAAGALWWNNSINPALGGVPEDRRGQWMEFAAVARPAVLAAPSRRATYNAPLASSRAPVGPNSPDHPRRRATMPAALLPSVQSLLTRIPPGRLKRPRVGDANDPSRFSLRAGQSSSSSPREQPGGWVDTCRGREAAHRLGGESGGGGAGKSDGLEDSSKSGKPATALEGIPAVADMNNSGGSSNRRQRQGGDRWTERRRSWNPNPLLSHGTSGVVASAPSPEWRRLGLASMGRVASFDEAAAALRANGLHQHGAAAEDPSKPRRSSAFVSHGSALSPVVTEMGRRDSAFEARALAPAASRVPHYSDLLSAKASSRGVTAVNGHRGHHFPLVTLRNTGTIVEEGGSVSRAALPGEASVVAETRGSMPPWDTPTPGSAATLQPGPKGAGAAAAGGGRGGGIPPPTVVSRAAVRMFHVMPATAAFTAGLASRSRGADDVDLGAGADGARRLSVESRAPSGPAGKQGEGMTLVPAWGAPSEEANRHGDSTPDDKGSVNSSAAGVNFGGERGRREPGGGEYEFWGRHPIRGSMAPGAASTGDESLEARRSSVLGIVPPGGGVKEEERLAEGPANESQNSGDVAGSGTFSSQAERVKGAGGSRRGSMGAGPGWSFLTSGDGSSRTNGSRTNGSRTNGSHNGSNAAAGSMSPPMPRASAAKTGDRRGSVEGVGALSAVPPPPAPSEKRRGSVVVAGVIDPPGARGPPTGKELAGVQDDLVVQRGFMVPTRSGEMPADVGRGDVQSESQEQQQEQ